MLPNVCLSPHRAGPLISLRYLGYDRWARISKTCILVRALAFGSVVPRGCLSTFSGPVGGTTEDDVTIT